ncbi:MAG: response regulator [Anaerolineales bacterium]|nr:response regulator [Anaerolineales bacterium]
MNKVANEANGGLRVLVVDDERAIRRLLQISLTVHGHTVYEASNGQQTLTVAVHCRPDIIILDLGLPDIAGIEVIRRLREWTQTPIIILSVRDREADKIAALDTGADDYLTKPFSVGELMARMRVVLRRATTLEDKPIFTSGALTVDLTRRIVKVDKREVQLTPTEYDLLKLLITHAGKVMTNSQILRQVWGPGQEDNAHMLRVNMSNLRRKLEADPTRPIHIITEPGVGYRLRAD